MYQIWDTRRLVIKTNQPRLIATDSYTFERNDQKNTFCKFKVKVLVNAQLYSIKN